MPKSTQEQSEDKSSDTGWVADLFIPNKRPADKQTRSQSDDLYVPGQRPETSGDPQPATGDLNTLPQLFFGGSSASADLLRGFSAATSLSQVISINGLIDYLLRTNTFFHGKVGFYHHVMRHILGIAGLPFEEPTNVYDVEQLKTKAKESASPADRLTLLLLMESTEQMNKAIKTALGQTDVLWLVAPLSSVQKQFLLPFKNFFIDSGSEEELRPLRDIFRLPMDAYRVLTDTTQSNAVFVTTYQPILERLAVTPIALIRIIGFD